MLRNLHLVMPNFGRVACTPNGATGLLDCMDRDGPSEGLWE